MNFTTDNYFSIGQAHVKQGSPCQDYAFSGVSGKVAVAIVADGCSTGGETDVGSRVVARSTLSVIAAQRVLIEQPGWNVHVADLHMRQKTAFAISRETLSLRTSDLLATCLTVICTPTNGVVCMQGDGVAVIIYADGAMDVHNVEWKGQMADGSIVGAPLYPSYSPSDIEAFLVQFHGGNALVNRPIHEKWTVSADGVWTLAESVPHVFSESMDGIVIPVDPVRFASGSVRFVGVFSDGALQVDGVSWQDAVKNLVTFKTLEGAFLTRRMMRQIKEWKKNGDGPLDDIAGAVVYMKEANSEENMR